MNQDIPVDPAILYVIFSQTDPKDKEVDVLNLKHCKLKKTATIAELYAACREEYKDGATPVGIKFNSVTIIETDQKELKLGEYFSGHNSIVLEVIFRS
ncbi:hypothetical protein GGF41_001703 [Coemansia sp. RSA 2531]|nr:hypothetical protein GGF41_001703 [Coemansia sp. RSA 2531]